MTRNSSFIRTDKAIMQAFIELLKEKPFEKITVQNILDATPVTRATFYAHYHDKYEIAERMLEEFLQNRDDVRMELAQSKSSGLYQIVKKNASHNHAIAEALLKIHTEKVDLHKAIVDDFKKEYLSDHKSSKRSYVQIEAHIYAHARASLEFAHIHDSGIILPFQEVNRIFLNVALRLLHLSDDPEVRAFLEKKLSKKFTLD